MSLLYLLSLLVVASMAQEILKDLPMDPCLNGGVLVNVSQLPQGGILPGGGS